MKCAWKELLGILPPNLRPQVDKYENSGLQELRLRCGRPACLVLADGNRWLGEKVDNQSLQFVVNMASKYSPWSCVTAKDGYITASGGHRIGMCGVCIMKDGAMTGIRDVTSLCIRVARDITDIAPDWRGGSVLILGPPGSGKTTLLRDLIRRISDGCRQCVAVVDERGELFPTEGGFPTGMCTDVLYGCTKAHGVSIALRTMGPKWIAVDEITAVEDCAALVQAGWCGVKLLATAHASDAQDLLRRKVYRPLVDSGLFEDVLVLREDKTWRMERVRI